VAILASLVAILASLEAKLEGAAQVVVMKVVVGVLGEEAGADLAVVAGVMAALVEL
jgi:hypothetical protein